MIKPNSLITVVFLLVFILSACTEETSTDNGSEENDKEEEAEAISIDGIVYALNPVSISAENTVYAFTITNENDEEKELSFTTSQRYEYELRDQDDELIKRFSDDMAFMQVLEDIPLPPGEELSYELKLPSLEPGKYTLTAHSVAKGLSGNQVTAVFTVDE